MLIAAANSRDSQHALRFAQQAVDALPGHRRVLATAGPDAGIGSSGWTLLAGLALAGSAALLAFTSYRPRLLEYRSRLILVVSPASLRRKWRRRLTLGRTPRFR